MNMSDIQNMSDIEKFAHSEPVLEDTYFIALRNANLKQI